MDYIKNLLFVPFLQFFAGIQAYLPFDLMGMLGLTAVKAAASGTAVFNLNTLTA